MGAQATAAIAQRWRAEVGIAMVRAMHQTVSKATGHTSVPTSGDDQEAPDEMEIARQTGANADFVSVFLFVSRQLSPTRLAAYLDPTHSQIAHNLFASIV